MHNAYTRHKNVLLQNSCGPTKNGHLKWHICHTIDVVNQFMGPNFLLLGASM